MFKTAHDLTGGIKLSLNIKRQLIHLSLYLKTIVYDNQRRIPASYMAKAAGKR
jgi:hypothetical protein